MLGGVFISYRREDSGGFAGRIYDRLTNKLGRESVFFDVDNIAPGLDFFEVLSERVGRCDALVAVIGTDWISSVDEGNRRRLDDPDDFVRIEIEAALQRGVRVIPVLVDGATMPRREDLPDSLKKLARRQGIEISHSRFDSDVERLTRALALLEEELRQREAAEAERAAREERERREVAEQAEKAEQARRLAEAEAQRADADRRAREAAEADRAAKEEQEKREAGEAAEKAEQGRRLAETEAQRLIDDQRAREAAEAERAARPEREKREAAEAARRAHEERHAREAEQAERAAREERERREAAEAAARAEDAKRLAEAGTEWRAEEERRTREGPEVERAAGENRDSREAEKAEPDKLGIEGEAVQAAKPPGLPAEKIEDTKDKFAFAGPVGAPVRGGPLRSTPEGVARSWSVGLPVALGVSGLAIVLVTAFIFAERSRQASPPIPQSTLVAPPPPNEAVQPKQPDGSTTSGRSLTSAQERALKAGDSLKECGDCPDMIVVPAGRFTMGSPVGQGSDFERPAHDVTIAKPFAVAKFALTFDAWDACAANGDCAQHVGDSGWGRGRRPAINVSWDDAQTYVKWVSRITGKEYRLLSEAEYEYAARAGTQSKYPWGDGIKRDGKAMANCNGCGSQWDGKQTAPVGSFGANAFGLYDMVGNVYEWTKDCWNAT